ncbi:hypothetical protein [Streptococcus suis]|uniref:hypothetical protein n=1 Tax=Streptococcus suis TaxID=1307 RepID=UPI001ABED44B|nr:hypothetical protein [Streptococcus suis]
MYHFKTDDEEYKELQIEMKKYLALINQKINIDALAKNLIAKGLDTLTDEEFLEIKKTTASNTSTDQSETDSDSNT